MSSAFLYSASARAKSPLASSATAKLLWARASLGDFSQACSNRNAASRHRPFLATSVPNAICVDAFSGCLYDVQAPATRSKEKATMLFEFKRLLRFAARGRSVL